MESLDIIINTKNVHSKIKITWMQDNTLPLWVPIRARVRGRKQIKFPCPCRSLKKSRARALKIIKRKAAKAQRKKI